MTRVTAGAGADSRLRGKNRLLGIAMRLGRRKDDRECRPHADFALHGQVAARPAGEVAADRAAESRAVARADDIAIDLDDRLEHRGELLLRNTDARVGYPNVHGAAVT